MITMSWTLIGLNWSQLECLEMTFVVIWLYINKTELNWIQNLMSFRQLSSIFSEDLDIETVKIVVLFVKNSCQFLAYIKGTGWGPEHNPEGHHRHVEMCQRSNHLDGQRKSDLPGRSETTWLQLFKYSHMSLGVRIAWLTVDGSS